MDPIRIRVARIIDFGKMVAVLGVDLETDKVVVIHIDHRPLDTILDSWKAPEFAQPLSFEADQLTLSLEMVPDGGDDGGEHQRQARAA
jgi:hypothetical protein